MRNPLALGLAIVALALSPTASAAGDETAALLHSGIQKYKAQDYEGARDAFARAYALDPRPSTLLELGLAELQGGHPAEAARHLRRYLRTNSGPEEKRQLVEGKWLPRAEEQLGHVRVSAPPGSELTVDGDVWDASDDVDVTPGGHEFAVRRGSWIEKRRVDVEPTQLVTVSFQAPSPPPQEAVAPSPTPVRAMEHNERRAPAKLATVSALGAAAAIATGLGVTFAVLSHDEARNAAANRGALASSGACGGTSPQPLCPTLRDAVAKQNAFASASDGLYIGAGVFAAAAITAAVLWPSRHARLAPRVDGRAVGLAFDATW